MHASVMDRDTYQVLLWNPILEWTCLLPVTNVEHKLGSQMCVCLSDGFTATPANFLSLNWVLPGEGSMLLM